MIRKITYIIVTVFALSSIATAADLPSYYPKAGFQRVGILDDVQFGRQLIVINDIPYSVSDNLIVHSTSSYSIPSSSLRIGSQVGYKFSSQGRLITEIWVLPEDYKSRARR